MHLCVSGIDHPSIFKIVRWDFGIVLTVCVFSFTLLITSKWYIQIIWHPENDQCSSLRHSYHVDWLIVEWVSDCYLTPHELFYSCTLARTSYIRWDDDDDDIWFVLDQPAELDCVVLAHCSNSPRVDMSLHSDTLSWLRATQSALTPQWYVLTEATKTNCIVFGLKLQRLEPTIYRTWGHIR